MRCAMTLIERLQWRAATKTNLAQVPIEVCLKGARYQYYLIATVDVVSSPRKIYIHVYDSADDLLWTRMNDRLLQP